MKARTVQVTLIDGSTVTVPEPAWCLGRHENGLHLVDLCHDGPETELTVATNLGDVSALDACLTQYPYSSNTGDRGIKAAVGLAGACYRFDPAGLHALADGLTRRAIELRTLARQLAELRAAQA